ncbi:ClpP/crotonase-like domain-containing protein [Aspergillus pseudoustus]|uniref:ClpP/crotonase-like domain-containing protein n=1 Tax=Aspergillus pseudoustus TaxID=1810923 RepID=A0ABR4JZM2_9EURO
MALFSRSIPSGGYFICAMLSDNVYFLVFESPPENHFSPSFVDTFRSCLETIERSYPPGVLVTASRIPSSYCGDFPLIPDERQRYQAWHLLRQILTYPMPTIAFINGHAVGMGFLLALCHDFRIQGRPDSSLRICQEPSSVDLAPRLNLVKAISPCSTVVSSRIANGKPLYGREAIKRGLVDMVAHVNGVFKFIKDRELLRVPSTPTYRESKIRSNRKALRVLDSIDEETGRHEDNRPETGSTNRKHYRESKI